MPLMPMPPLAQNAIEPMQVDAPIEDNDNNEEHQVIVENATLDLEMYANSYAGLARLHRLMFVADVCPALRIEALKMAISCVLSTYNVTLYQVLHKKLNETLVGSSVPTNAGGAGAANNGIGGGAGGNVQGGAAAVGNGVAGGGGAAPIVLPGGAYLMSVGGPLPDIAVAAQPAGVPTAANAQAQDLPVFDPAWVEAKSKKAALKLEKLDSDLKNYKSNSIKESIRRGQDDLGDHYLSCGDLSNALKCYSRARDYCTSGKHVVNMCLNVIKVSLYLQNWSHVLSYVSKAESTPDFAEHSKEANQSVYTRLKCAAGIAELQTRKYKSAAKHFLAANFDHCDFPEMISPNNVAMYGGLCALATFERHELQKTVITSSSFKLFLELEPQLRDIIFKFYESKYASCLKLLAEIRENLLLDMYIAPHVTALYTKIRNRALIQYFSPYLSADMRKMAEAFNCTVPALENEVMQLILDGQIQARIDSHNKVLFAKEADQRSTTYERAMTMGKDYQRRSRMLILRAAMLRSRIHVKVTSSVKTKIENLSDLTNNESSISFSFNPELTLEPLPLPDPLPESILSYQKYNFPAPSFNPGPPLIVPSSTVFFNYKQNVVRGSETGNLGGAGGSSSSGGGVGGAGGSSDMCVAAAAGSSTTTTTTSSSSTSTTRNH